MFPTHVLALAEEVVSHLATCRLKVALAESCTGGLIGGCLTSVPGSSEAFERGFVTYSNASKTDLLGVPEGVLARFGAVSAACAEAMAAGALARSQADLALAITGIAGPGGATPDKPVGLVYFGLARYGAAPTHEDHILHGDRAGVRLGAVVHALNMLLTVSRPRAIS